ncbi:MAG: Mce-associated rane protein [Mycobacterium sp.]|nr:Mce-associated rane protein [Mycobacterium sp.]
MVATDSDLRPDDDTVDAADEVDEIDEEGGSSEPAADDADSEPKARSKKRMSPQRWAMLFSLTVIVALSVQLGWLGFRVHQAQKAEAQRSQFLQVARQGALNLTTIDWQHADADVRRILDGATGEFHDDFAKRSQPFIQVVQQAKASTVGTITEAGLESETADTAQALVAVSVQTSNAGETDQEPRAWRMRIYEQRVGNQIKVSNVGFVP